VVIAWRLTELALPRVTSWKNRRAAATFLSPERGRLPLPETTIRYGTGENHAILFTDYECPGCRAQEEILERTQGPGVEVSYRQLPIVSLHPHAVQAARIAVCSAKANAFEIAHRALVGESSWSTAPDPSAWLESHGMPPAVAGRVGVCLATTLPDSQIAADRLLARRLGLNGTPGWVLADSVHVGVLLPAELESTRLEQ